MKLQVATSQGELTLVVSDSLYSQCVFVRQWGLLVDLGDFMLPDMAGVRTVLLTHSHLDHVLHGCAKLALYAKKRERTVPVWTSPEDAVRLPELFDKLAAFDHIPALFAALDVRPSDEVAIRSDLVARPFTTQHAIPSRGWTVWRRTSHLLPSFEGISQDEIAERARAGERVEGTRETPVFTVTGDTTLAGVPEQALESEVLVTECAMPSRGPALERFGHLCPADIEELLSRFTGRAMVVMHTSHRTREALAGIDDLRMTVVGVEAP
jgi:ribonuclease Z